MHQGKRGDVKRKKRMKRKKKAKRAAKQQLNRGPSPIVESMVGVQY